MRTRALSVTLRLALSVGLLAIVAFAVADPREILSTIAGISGPALVLMFLLTVADRVLMAFKWRLLLHARAIRLPLGTAVRAYFASSFAGLFLPVTLGADAVRIFASRAFGVADVTASIIVERTLGAFAVMSVALVSLALVARSVAGLTTLPLMAMAVSIACLAGLAFPLSLKLTSRWAARTADGSRLGRVAAAYGGYAAHPAVLVAFFGLSVIESLIPALVAYVAARGLGVDVSFSLFVATMPIALAVARLPISLGGFGVQEVSFVYLAGLLGLSASDAAATMLVTDAVLVLTLLPAAFDVSMLGRSRRVV